MSGTGVGAREVIQAWGRILNGYRPILSIEITKECPLPCPGCYAYGDEHLGGDVTLREVSRFQGQTSSSTACMALVDRTTPLHVSIVGGEPLVRYRELDEILPQLTERGIHTQVVTSAVRPIPAEWTGAAAPAGRRLDRRAAARARRAPHAGDLRPHPQAHRRAPDHRALHGHAAAGPARRLSRRVPAVLAGQPEHATDLDEPLHAAERRDVDGAADARRTDDASIADLRRLRRVPEAPHARRDDRTSTRTRRVARRLHLRADDRVLLGRPRAQHHPVSVRRQSGLPQCGCIASAGLEAIGRHQPQGLHSVGPGLHTPRSRREGGRAIDVPRAVRPRAPVSRHAEPHRKS